MHTGLIAMYPACIRGAASDQKLVLFMPKSLRDDSIRSGFVNISDTFTEKKNH